MNLEKWKQKNTDQKQKQKYNSCITCYIVCVNVFCWMWSLKLFAQNTEEIYFNSLRDLLKILNLFAKGNIVKILKKLLKNNARELKLA